VSILIRNEEKLFVMETVLVIPGSGVSPNGLPSWLVYDYVVRVSGGKWGGTPNELRAMWVRAVENRGGGGGVRNGWVGKSSFGL